jgi:hypothetical protein
LRVEPEQWERIGAVCGQFNVRCTKRNAPYLHGIVQHFAASTAAVIGCTVNVMDFGQVLGGTRI